MALRQHNILFLTHEERVLLNEVFDTADARYDSQPKAPEEVAYLQAAEELHQKLEEAVILISIDTQRGLIDASRNERMHGV